MIQTMFSRREHDDDRILRYIVSNHVSSLISPVLTILKEQIRPPCHATCVSQKFFKHKILLLINLQNCANTMKYWIYVVLGWMDG